ARFAPPAPSAGGEEPVLLPGESLAKYRGRPATMLPPDEPERETPAAREEGVETMEAAAPAAAPPASEVQAPSLAQRIRRGLPSWLLAQSESETPADAAPVQEESSAPQAAAPAAPAPSEPDLNEDDVTALSSSLAEARHEETGEEAEADAVTGNGAIEEEAEEEATEVADALGESIMDAQEEEELAAEEAHDEAIAAASEEAHGEEPHHEEAHEEHLPAEAHAHADEHAQPAELAAEEFLLPGETRSIPSRPRPYTPPPARFPSRPESQPQAAPEEGYPEDRQPEDNQSYVGQPREDRGPRDSARVGGDPRARFQRPQRGGRDRGRGGPRHGRRDRGGRPRFERSGGGRGPQGRPEGAHRRPQLISEMLKAGQEVVVQIAKEPLGKKGARITSHIALPGRFLVYMPTIDHVGVSRKIPSAENRSRLRRLVGEAKGNFPGGFIVRTAAGEATDEEVRADIEFLGQTWSKIKKNGEDRKAPSLLHRDLNLVERILRDYVNEEYTAIWVDNEEEYGKIVEFVTRFQPKMVGRVKLYSKETPIFEEFGIQHDLDKALRPKVWLKSGGYIVINHTEALVAIDVNTGKYVGKGSTRLEDTIVKTNLEAVKEIVRQIRLRDLGGIIVADFIDMEERRNREKVLAALQQALDQDKAPSKALGFNEFGLVCITRKRTKQALERVLCQPCQSCSGSGMVKSIPTLCYEIQAEARKMAKDHEEANLTIRVHPEIAKALKTREAMLIDELEQTSHKHVIIQSDATLHWEQYDIY
ncbi:MAG: Rne/Rng family ribonuclease, partial [Acidobacteriia bacterium]|nr:Rne/Rng family ribonuclease [Terriglobia bacterium]